MNAPDPKPVLDLIRRLLVEMIVHPEALRLEHKPLTAGMILTIQAHAADTPRLIGAGAGNYRALVAIIAALGNRIGYRITVPQIKEPQEGEPERYRFEGRDDWPAKKIFKLLAELLGALFENPNAVIDEYDNEGFISTWEVFISRRETPELIESLRPHIARIFDAIGRANHRILCVDLIRESDPSQPEFADGRNAKASR